MTPTRVRKRRIGKWQKVRRYEGARGSVRHCHIHDEEAAGAIIAIKNADIGTALSGGLIGCIALAQVPNDGHRIVGDDTVAGCLNVRDVIIVL